MVSLHSPMGCNSLQAERDAVHSSWPFCIDVAHTEDFKVRYEPWNVPTCCPAPCAHPPSQHSIFFSQGNMTRQKISQWAVRNNFFLCDNKYMCLFDTVNNPPLNSSFASGNFLKFTYFFRINASVYTRI